jgi:hypothetical protein
MNTHVISVHGFNVYDAGKNTVAKMLPYFEQLGCTTEVFDYGFFNLFNPRWRNQNIADKLSERIRDLNFIDVDVIIVAHSNGCAIAHMTSNCKIKTAVYINPALDRSRSFPETIERAHVWHSPSDLPVRLSRLLPFHTWGAMGAYGATGDDKRVTNFNKQHDFHISSRKHSDVFDDDKLEFFGPLIVKKSIQ